MKRFECSPNDTEETKHVLNIFNMALEMHNSYIIPPDINMFDYTLNDLCLEVFFSMHCRSTRLFNGDIENVNCVDRYFLIMKCAKKYFLEKNIKIDIDSYLAKFYFKRKITAYVYVVLEAKCMKYDKLKQKYKDMSAKFNEKNNKYKKLKNHVLAQPDGELYFEAKKDWDSKTKKNK